MTHFTLRDPFYPILPYRLCVPDILPCREPPALCVFFRRPWVLPSRQWTEHSSSAAVFCLKHARKFWAFWEHVVAAGLFWWRRIINWIHVFFPFDVHRDLFLVLRFSLRHLLDAAGCPSISLRERLTKWWKRLTRTKQSEQSQWNHNKRSIRKSPAGCPSTGLPFVRPSRCERDRVINKGTIKKLRK